VLIRNAFTGSPLYAVQHDDCCGPWRATVDEAAAEWNAANAAPDPALRALEQIDLSRYRSVLPMAHHDQARADAELALARFGAYVVRDWFRRTSGFQAADGYQLDAGALEVGIVTHGATVGYRHAPGIAAAIAALLAPGGAGEVPS
jgi:hypothetical protein